MTNLKGLLLKDSWKIHRFKKFNYFFKCVEFQIWIFFSLLILSKQSQFIQNV